MIQVRDLTKDYGETRALHRVTFTIDRGQVVGLLGHNGAGKTTLMKILVGFLLPTSGDASVGGFDVVTDPRAVQEKVGYLPENAPLYHEMLVQDFLGFCADMRRLPLAAKKDGLERVVHDCGLAEVLTRPIGHLSKGYRQRVGLAAAMIHDPEILILDEPTSGLDPTQIAEIRSLIRRMAKAKTLILSTHILSEVEATCDRALILIGGQLRADGTLDDLTRAQEQIVTLKVGKPEAAVGRLAGIPGVTSVQASDPEDGFITFRLRLQEQTEIGEAVAQLVREQGWPLRELRRNERDLEQVFRELTEAEMASGEALA